MTIWSDEYSRERSAIGGIVSERRCKVESGRAWAQLSVRRVGASISVPSVSTHEANRAMMLWCWQVGTRTRLLAMSVVQEEVVIYFYCAISGSLFTVSRTDIVCGCHTHLSILVYIACGSVGEGTILDVLTALTLILKYSKRMLLPGNRSTKIAQRYSPKWGLMDG